MAKKLRGHFTSVKEMEENLAITNYVMAQDGNVYMVKKNEIGLFSAKPKIIYDLDPWKEGFVFALPKIPVEFLYQAINFFRHYITAFSGTEKEVMVQIFWNRSLQEYFVYVPEQKVTKTSIKLLRNVELEKEHLLVLDMHSHNSMSAFFSPTDDEDEKETRLFAVIGRLDLIHPDIKLRMSCAGNFVNVTMDKIFCSKNIHAIDAEAFSYFPKEWHEQVKFL